MQAQGTGLIDIVYVVLVDGCLCLHAEENALLEAGRERIGEDSVIYCNTYVQTIFRICNYLRRIAYGLHLL